MMSTQQPNLVGERAREKTGHLPSWGKAKKHEVINSSYPYLPVRPAQMVLFLLVLLLLFSSFSSFFFVSSSFFFEPTTELPRPTIILPFCISFFLLSGCFSSPFSRYQVCNHPELFERRDVKSPFHMKLPDYYRPKLLYREG